MKCPKCQAENEPGVKFCGDCGAAMPASKPAPAPAKPAAPRPAQVFCSRCGAANSTGGAFCSACGSSLNPGAAQARPAAAGQAAARKETSWAWWLLPLFLTWVGGLIGFLVLKDDDPGKAKRILIFGIVWAVVGIVLAIALQVAVALLAY